MALDVLIDNVSVREVGQDWGFGTGWSIAEDKAVCDGSVVGNSFLISTGNTLTIGKTYKVQYTILDYIQGNIRVRAGDATSIFVNADGSYTEYMVATNTETCRIQARNNFIGSITNISVKEVGQNWNLIGTATITENQANIVTASAVTGISQTNVLTIGESYKLTYNIVSNNNGGLKISGNEIPSVVGNNTYYFEATATALEILRNSGVTDITITNISIIEITDDTNLPRINYEGFSYQDALGSEEVVNGDFATDSDWLKGAGWTISGGTANAAIPVASGLTAIVGALTIGTTYKLTYTISNYSAGNIVIQAGWQSSGTSRSANGTYTEYLVCAGDTKVAFLGTSSFTGSIDNVSVKEYLGQSVVPGSGCGSWLFESQSTNLVPYSEDFSDASWVNSNSTDTSNYGISPDGLNNSTRFLTTANTGSFLYINSLPILDATNYTLSFWVKSNGNSLDKFRLYTTTGGTSLEFTSTNKWVRYEYNFLSTGTTTNLGIRGVVSQETDIQIWGAQLEQQSYATSYIPTNGEANGVTRNQDVCTNGGSLASINSTEGTLYAEIASLSNEVSSNHISLSDGTYNNRISLMYSNGTNIIRAFLRLGGVPQADLAVFASDITEFHKVAFKYKENDFALWIDGVEVRTDTSGSTIPSGTLTKLAFSEISTTFGAFRGKTKALAVWKEALSDSELQSLTTI